MTSNIFHENILKGKRFISEILDAVENGTLEEPFYPSDIQKAVPGWGNQTYHLFPWKHCFQNPELSTTALFYYVGKNIPKPKNPPYRKRNYRLLRSSDKKEATVISPLKVGRARNR